jgi:O-antigen/teichoic acid export membrane protein
MLKLRRVAASVSWLTASQIARSVTSLVLTAILARLLSPGDFGLMALVMMASGFIGVFSDTGMASAIVRLEAPTEDQLTSAFWLSCGVTTVLAVIGVAAAPAFAAVFREPRIVPLVSVALVTLPVSALGQVPDALLQRRLAFREIAIIEWLGTLIAGVFAVILALRGAGVWALLMQLIGSVTVSSIGRMIAARWRPRGRFRWAALHGLLSFGIAVLAGSIVNFGFRRVDNFIIGRTLGTIQLGYYALAYNLVVMPLFTVGGVVLRVLYPVLSQYQRDGRALREAYVRAMRVLATATLPLVIGLAATAPVFITAIYGAKWGPSIPLVRLLAVIGIFEAVNTAGTVIYARGRPQVLVGWAVVSIIVLSVAITIGTGWGATGAALCYAVVAPLLYIVPHLLANRMIDLPFRAQLRAVGPALSSAVLMGVIVYLLSPLATRLSSSPSISLIVLVTTGAALYSMLLTAMAVVFGRRTGGSVAWILGRHFSPEDALNV